MIHQVSVSVLLTPEGPSWDTINNALFALLGSPQNAGTGFGQRNMEWNFTTKEEAFKAMRSALNISDITYLNVSYVLWPEWEQEARSLNWSNSEIAEAGLIEGLEWPDEYTPN